MEIGLKAGEIVPGWTRTRFKGAGWEEDAVELRTCFALNFVVDDDDTCFWHKRL